MSTRMSWALVALTLLAGEAQGQQRPKIFISVDMEGIGGIGTGAMTSAAGKDYGTGRKLMTDEVNAVVAAILARGPADIVVNDSHGDMQNLLHTELDPRVRYIQGALKPLGMVEGLDSTFDGVIFLGYHARAGTPNGFLAHTGTGSVKGLWLNGREAGEGDLNASYAGSVGVPVLLAAGDSALVEQLAPLLRGGELVTTKHAMTPQSAKLLHPQVVRDRLSAATRRALDRRAAIQPVAMNGPVRVRLRLADTATPQILEAIPGVKRVDGFTVEVDTPNMTAAYKLIRLMYRYVSVS